MNKTRKNIIIDGTTFEVKMDYPYAISRHEVKSKDTISFFHYVPKYVRNEESGLLEFDGKEEVHWFDFTPHDKELSLRSDCRFYFHKDYSCSDGALMLYLRECSGAKLISSRALDKYDDNPYGKSEIVGKFIYEVWDIRGLWESQA